MQYMWYMTFLMPIVEITDLESNTNYSNQTSIRVYIYEFIYIYIYIRVYICIYKMIFTNGLRFCYFHGIHNTPTHLRTHTRQQYWEMSKIGRCIATAKQDIIWTWNIRQAIMSYSFLFGDIPEKYSWDITSIQYKLIIYPQQKKA